LAIGQSLQDEEEGKALLSAQGDCSADGHDVQDALSEREYVNWLKTVIELAELANTPDRRSIKRVFERTPLEYWERLEAEIQKIIEAMICQVHCR